MTRAKPSSSIARTARFTPFRAKVPPRSEWYYGEPVKVFDNLYFFGQSEYAVWAITTSEGIIVLDTIFDYSVEEEVAGGMKKLGLDPATIKYAVVWQKEGGRWKLLQDIWNMNTMDK